MQTSWKPLLALLAANLLPAQINPKVWNLIGPDDKIVFGVDLDRYRHTALSSADGGEAALPFGGTARYAITAGDPQKEQPLRILLGFTLPDGQRDHGQALTMLDATTAILGDEEHVRDGVARWNGESPLSELATEARKLAESDDAWFVVVKPLALANRAQPAAAPKHLAEVIDVVEQAAGGVRFGAYYRAHLDVHAKTSDDAYSLAALGRWLPGLIQAMAPGGRESRVIDMAENLAVQAVGRTVTLSFELPEDKLQELLKQMKSDIVE